MGTWLLHNEVTIRLALFGGILALMAVWELSMPALPPREPRARRWFANLGVLLLGTVSVRVLAPVGAVALAHHAQTEGVGLCNQFAIPKGVAIIAAMVALDLVIYLQHVVFHSCSCHFGARPSDLRAIA